MGREDVSPVSGGKLPPIVKRQLQRSIVRLKQNIRNQHVRRALGMLARVARVGMASDVEPRPTIKTPVRDMGDVVGDQIVAQLVAFIDRGPQGARARLNGDADRVANSRSKHPHAAAIGVEFQDVGAMEFVRVFIRIVVVGPRAHRHEHLLSVE